MSDVVLVEPRIPQNVGAVARLCAACRAGLHIVRPIPFTLTDRSLKRAGMDYLHLVELTVHENWDSCREHFQGRRLFGLSSKAEQSVYKTRFSTDDVLVFGSEEAGLPNHVTSALEGSMLTIPMLQNEARCLNLATSVAITLFELNRQVVGWSGQ